MWVYDGTAFSQAYYFFFKKETHHRWNHVTRTNKSQTSAARSRPVTCFEKDETVAPGERKSHGDTPRRWICARTSCRLSNQTRPEKALFQSALSPSGGWRATYGLWLSDHPHRRTGGQADRRTGMGNKQSEKGTGGRSKEGIKGKLFSDEPKQKSLRSTSFRAKEEPFEMMTSDTYVV